MNIIEFTLFYLDYVGTNKVDPTIIEHYYNLCKDSGLCYADYLHSIRLQKTDLKFATKEEYEQIHQEKNAAILKEIEEIKKIGKAGGYDNRTWVDTILFRIDLTHYPETAFLDKKITFNGGVDDVKKILNSMEIAQYAQGR